MAEAEPTREELLQTAGLWLAKLDSGSASAAEVEAWRDADPRHAAAWARVAGLNFQMNRLRPLVAASDDEGLPKSGGIHRRRLLMAGAGGVFVLGGASALTLWAPSRASATTAVGETRSLVLADGSVLDINTATKVTWRITEAERQIWLDSGEIALVIRPASVVCQITCGSESVLVTEGEVNARRRASALNLTILRGEVRLASGSGGGGPIAAGHFAQVDGAKVQVRATDAAEVDFTAGWRQGELVFSGQSLAVAVAEYNRYLPYRISIRDPALADIHLGGRFKTTDPQGFLAALKTGFGIQAKTDRNGEIVLTR